MIHVSRLGLGLGLLVCGCPDRPVDNDGAGEPTTTSASEGTGSGTTDGEGASGALEPCLGGLVRCGDDCVDLQYDSFNCGECGRVCPLAEHSPWSCTWDGQCPPTLGPCIHLDDEIPHCEALCNSVGQHCADTHHVYWFSSQEGATCGHKTTSTTTVYDMACDAPFDWDKVGGFAEPVVAARCKCTNDF